MQLQFDKILVAAPTASAKNYCLGEWMENTVRMDYPNFDVVLFDNTDDCGENANRINNLFKKLFGKWNKLKAFHSFNNKPASTDSVIERMCKSHNDCRDYFLKNDYKKWLHLETDVFPDKDALTNLYCHDKDIVGAIYHRDIGSGRKLMVQKRIVVDKKMKKIQAVNVDKDEDAYFIDGTLKSVASIGLGCVLISRKVAEQIPFRFVLGENMHPDSYFSEDCFKNKFEIFADTSCISKHENQVWGIYGKDFF